MLKQKKYYTWCLNLFKMFKTRNCTKKNCLVVTSFRNERGRDYKRARNSKTYLKWGGNSLCYELICVSLRKQDLVSWHRIRNWASVEKLLVMQGFRINQQEALFFFFFFFSAFVLSSHNIADIILSLVT